MEDAQQAAGGVGVGAHGAVTGLEETAGTVVGQASANAGAGNGETPIAEPSRRPAAAPAEDLLKGVKVLCPWACHLNLCSSMAACSYCHTLR